MAGNAGLNNTEFVRRVYEAGKLTIPKELRDLYDIREGDYVKLAIVEVVRRKDVAPEAAAEGGEVS